MAKVANLFNMKLNMFLTLLFSFHKIINHDISNDLQSSLKTYYYHCHNTNIKNITLSRARNTTMHWSAHSCHTSPSAPNTEGSGKERPLFPITPTHLQSVSHIPIQEKRRTGAINHDKLRKKIILACKVCTIC